MSETCSKCGKEKPIVLDRQLPDGSRKGLCKTCADKWLGSNEEWPPLPKK